MAWVKGPLKRFLEAEAELKRRLEEQNLAAQKILDATRVPPAMEESWRLEGRIRMELAGYVWVDDKQPEAVKPATPAQREKPLSSANGGRWTPEQDERLIKLAMNIDLSLNEIARKMGRTKCSVNGRIYRLRRSRKLSFPDRSGKTPENKDRNPSR